MAKLLFPELLMKDISLILRLTDLNTLLTFSRHLKLKPICFKDFSTLNKQALKFLHKRPLSSVPSVVAETRVINRA